MADRKRTGTTPRARTRPSVAEQLMHCELRPVPEPVLAPEVSGDRMRAILVGRTKWVNGTPLRYYFFDRDTDGESVRFSDGSTRFVSWVGAEEQREVVRRAFAAWHDVGLGVSFQEVTDRSEAEVRIGFMAGDGSWSNIGRDVLGVGMNERTMNFGWSLTNTYRLTTALHEIGHTLGLPHEHQNPNAGIVWDEQKVYDYFGGPPNRWSRDKTFYNVLRKLNPAEVEGSTWDPLSIMEYGFPAGLISSPAQYHGGLNPPGTLSEIDRQWALTWYPAQAQLRRLTPFASVPLSLKAGEQADFSITPTGSRKYVIATFGAADTVVVLFEDVNGQLRYVAGDDDSGLDRNARLEVKLFQGRKYVLRVRLYYAWATGQSAVMMW